MNLFEIQQKYNTHEKCIKHLEAVRWGNEPICPHCQSTKVAPRKTRKYFYHCNKCGMDFTVLFGTVFESSKLPLQKWFMIVALVMNARKGISAKNIQRDVGVTYKTAWYAAMRLRCAMIEEHELFRGIVEMDEVYIGGKPRKRNIPKDASVAYLSTITKNKRGKGTKKIKVAGAVERGGNVVTEVLDVINSKEMLAMLRRYVKLGKNTTVMTDEDGSYSKFKKLVEHEFVTHSKKEYVRGNVHTNTIEGFWSIVKNGLRGQYHVLSKKYLPFYLTEFAFKYNRRNRQPEGFEETIKNAITDVKCLTDYKPKTDVKKIVYGQEAGAEVTEKSEHKITPNPATFEKKVATRTKVKRKKKKVAIKKRHVSKIRKIKKVKKNKHTKRRKAA